MLIWKLNEKIVFKNKLISIIKELIIYHLLINKV